MTNIDQTKIRISQLEIDDDLSGQQASDVIYQVNLSAF